MEKYVLKLYITGRTSRSELAIKNLKEICKTRLLNKYQLEVIDVIESPQEAEDDKILATPTLIRQLPPPIKRIIGDLSNKEKVLVGLDLSTDV